MNNILKIECYFFPTSTAGQVSHILLDDVILWINSNMHAACNATTDLKFESCTALLSSSPVIEASKLVTIEVKSRSQTPSL